jgi:tryptophanyl-tRNA synthetase
MTEKTIVTPWDVKGKLDYDKLSKEFGISKINKLPESFEKELLFRRGIIFAHRDLNKIIEAVKNKNPFVMMTGLMPTGKMHIGHMILAQQMVFYQNLGAKVYVAVADVEAYNARGQGLEESRKIALEDYIENYVALGLDPKKCDIYFQSARSKDAKKSNAFYRLQNILARHATFNEFRAIYGDISPGKMISALLQASDMFHAQLPEFEGKMPVVVPVGIDQDPHLRLARDVAQRVKMFDFVQLSSTYHIFVPGLGGDKMSSSDPTSFIAMKDSPEEVKRKINKYAFSGGRGSVEEHRKKGGNPEVDVSFQYLKFIFEPDDKKLKQIEEEYRSGKMLTGELKSYTIEKINSFLKEHQKKMEKSKDTIRKYFLSD